MSATPRPLRTAPTWPAKITAQHSDGTIDAVPLTEAIAAQTGPGWHCLPLSLPGVASATVPIGAECIVQLLGGDRSRPAVVFVFGLPMAAAVLA